MRVSPGTILRDYRRTESDDFTLNVQPHISEYSEAAEIRDRDGKLLAWKIRAKYMNKEDNQK